MRFRNIDNNGDFTFGSGSNNYVTGNAAIALDIKTACLSFVNDCFFAQYDFIDWKNRLDYNQVENLKDELYSVISTRNGVNAVKTLDIEFVNHKFIASYDVITIYSSLQDNFTLWN